MSELKNELIKNTAKDITEFLDERYAIDVDYLDIAYFINTNLGWVFETVEENIE